MNQFTILHLSFCAFARKNRTQIQWIEYTDHAGKHRFNYYIQAGKLF